jgi:hypothetical protein
VVRRDRHFARVPTPGWNGSVRYQTAKTVQCAGSYRVIFHSVCTISRPIKGVTRGQQWLKGRVAFKDLFQR